VVAVAELHGDVVKVNALASWSESDVRAEATKRGVPLHPLYDHGYRSIGCAPCTRATGPGEHPRAGRWWWEDGIDRECGLHRLVDLEVVEQAS